MTLKKELLSGATSLQAGQTFERSSSPLVVPVFDSRRKRRAEVSRSGKPMCPVRVTQHGVMMIDGPEGAKKLVWADTGASLLAGELPAGSRVDIDVYTGAVRPL